MSGFVQVAPFLVFALFAGHVADKYDRRRIMVTTQTAICCSASLFLAFRARVPCSPFTSCLFLTAFARSFQGPARRRVLAPCGPARISCRRLSPGTAARRRSANVGGPALGGPAAGLGRQSIGLPGPSGLRGSGSILLLPAAFICGKAMFRWPRQLPARCSKACASCGVDKLILCGAVARFVRRVVRRRNGAVCRSIAVDILARGRHAALGWLASRPLDRGGCSWRLLSRIGPEDSIDAGPMLADVPWPASE